MEFLVIENTCKRQCSGFILKIYCISFILSRIIWLSIFSVFVASDSIRYVIINKSKMILAQHMKTVFLHR